MGLLTRDTDHDWEQLGAQNAYYAVVTHDAYDRTRLNDQSKAAFFETGRAHRDHVLNVIRKHIDRDFKPGRTLDFGCGVGRVLIPLAEVADHVVGVDVSASMLAETQVNCGTHEVTNVSLLALEDEDLAPDDEYDFIHSYIVLQHVPVKRGERLFRQLLARLKPGGVGAVHFTYAGDGSLRETLGWVRSHVPFIHRLANILTGRRRTPAPMQMNHYDLNHLFHILQDHAVTQVHIEHTQHGKSRGIMLYFRKPS